MAAKWPPLRRRWRGRHCCNAFGVWLEKFVRIAIVFLNLISGGEGLCVFSIVRLFVCQRKSVVRHLKRVQNFCGGFVLDVYLIHPAGHKRRHFLPLVVACCAALIFRNSGGDDLYVIFMNPAAAAIRQHDLMPLIALIHQLVLVVHLRSVSDCGLGIVGVIHVCCCCRDFDQLDLNYRLLLFHFPDQRQQGKHILPHRCADGLQLLRLFLKVSINFGE